MNRRAVYQGQFSKDDGREPERASIWTLLFGKSYMYREYFIDRDWVGDDEVNLYLDVVATARSLLRERYPGIEFVVVFWDNYGRSFSDEVDEGLSELADRYIRISDVAPDIERSPERYKLVGDAHPNALMQRLLAEHLAKELKPAAAN